MDTINKLTQAEATYIVNTSTRCTQATLRAFGINGYPFFGTGTLEYFTQAGFRLAPVKLKKDETVKQFVKNHPEGAYHLKTKGHAMALIDGILVDTAGRGLDGRKVEFAWRVEK